MRAQNACLQTVGKLSAFCRATAAALGLLVAFPAVGAETPPSPGAKFVGVDERTQRFEQPFPQTGCRKLSASLGICLEGSAFSLEESIVDGRDRLETYRADTGRTAALRSLFYDLRTALEIPPTELDTLVQRHLYDEAPRGPRKVIEILKETRRDSGLLGAQTALVETTDGTRALLQFNVFRNQWDLGFAETVIALPDGADTVPNLEEAETFHASFLDITRISVSVGPGY